MMHYTDPNDPAAMAALEARIAQRHADNIAAARANVRLHRETMTPADAVPLTHVLSTLITSPGVCLFCDRPYRAGMAREACPARAPLPPGNWQHSGPCVYCSHGPSCVRCEITGDPDRPVCFTCAEENTRAEIAADPYFRGDYYVMFGDDA